MQRRRLLKAMNEGPLNAKMVLAKCAAGLTVIVLIAVTGASESLDHGAAGDVAAAVAPPAAHPMQEHRKQVFDERRSRLENGHKRTNRMIEVVDLPKDLPMELL
jgi:hypothetical protein